ncbi:pantetheine-phosphate adenylyltransferase [Patescibacteria group bacterium]|nr:pantetheine-phosphate adenylyltransferase [Patescibacteria group bacterium]
MQKFKQVFLGGTFDHFHSGHKSFLAKAISLSDNLIIGITSDKFARQKKLSFSMESYDKRKKSVEVFLKNKKIKYEITKINDFFGPSITRECVDGALLVSRDNSSRSKIINKERVRRKLNTLQTIVLEKNLPAQDGSLVSSYRIRKGEISRDGVKYLNPKWLEKDLKLPVDLRKILKTPFGKVIRNLGNNYPELLFSVGDITTKNLIEASIKPLLSVIDFKVERKKTFSNIKQLGFKGNEKTISIDNPAGMISKNLFLNLDKIMSNLSKENPILIINGEDDLAVLPIVIFSPLQSIIFYGQPGKGMVKVIVSETIKNKAYLLLNKFDLSDY